MTVKYKYKCIRCKVGIKLEGENPAREAIKLGWYDVRFGNLVFTLCPHCVHELERFIAGYEIRKLVEEAKVNTQLQDDIENLVCYASNNDQMSDEEYQYLDQIKTRMQELGLHE